MPSQSQFAAVGARLGIYPVLQKERATGAAQVWLIPLVAPVAGAGLSLSPPRLDGQATGGMSPRWIARAMRRSMPMLVAKSAITRAPQGRDHSQRHLLSLPVVRQRDDVAGWLRLVLVHDADTTSGGCHSQRLACSPRCRSGVSWTPTMSSQSFSSLSSLSR
jgi:hypothetical protein